VGIRTEPYVQVTRRTVELPVAATYSRLRFSCVPGRGSASAPPPVPPPCQHNTSCRPSSPAPPIITTVEDNGETRALALPSCLSSPPPCWCWCWLVALRASTDHCCRSVTLLTSRVPRPGRACPYKCSPPRALWAPPPIHTPILHLQRQLMICICT